MELTLKSNLCRVPKTRQNMPSSCYEKSLHFVAKGNI